MKRYTAKQCTAEVLRLGRFLGEQQAMVISVTNKGALMAQMATIKFYRSQLCQWLRLLKTASDYAAYIKQWYAKIERIRHYEI